MGGRTDAVMSHTWTKLGSEGHQSSHSLSRRPACLKKPTLSNSPVPELENPHVPSYALQTGPALINSGGFLCHPPINYMAFINTGLMNGLCKKGELRGGVNTAPACTHVATY